MRLEVTGRMNGGAAGFIADNHVIALETLGLIKFDEPKPVQSVRQVIASVPVVPIPFEREAHPTEDGFYRQTLGAGYADRIEDALYQAGFQIVAKA